MPAFQAGSAGSIPVACSNLGLGGIVYDYNFRDRVAGDWDGPWMDMNGYGITVWSARELYGRIHHVVGPLQATEKLFQTIRTYHLKALHDPAMGAMGIWVEPSEIVVDGMKGGRNKMVVSYSLRAHRGPWTEDQQSAILRVIGTRFMRGFKDIPR